MNSKNPHKNLLEILLILGLFFLSGPTAAAISGAKGLASAEEAIRAENLIEKIHELASPEMEGRGSGTPGEARAADYIAREFRKIGLKPAGDRESYFQSFDITLGVRLGKDNRLIIFSSNLHDAERRSFSLYLIDTDGSGLERLTYDARFDSFPMFSRDGKKTRLCFHEERKGASGAQRFYRRLDPIRGVMRTRLVASCKRI